MKQASRAGSIADELLTSQGYARKLKEHRAWVVWEKVVGPQIAQHAKPLRIRDGILEVRVDQPIWMQQLRMMAPQILQRLNQALGEELIRDLFWKRGRLPEEIPVEPPYRAPRAALDAQETEKIGQALAGIGDEELQESLRRAMTRQAEFEKARREEKP
jgi:hypothetical protein